jgi:polysaccharide pyruvyl transferase WcaK-like protein
MQKIRTECVTWRWNGNLGDDLVYAAQEAMFQEHLSLGQYIKDPEAVLIGGGTLVPKWPENPELLQLSRRLPTAMWGTGIGDPHFWGKDHIPTWIEIVNNCNFVGVRGPLSAERLIEWGAPAQKVKWIGDAAMYYADTSAPPPRTGRHLAANLGKVYGKLYGDEAQLERAFIMALQRLAKSGWTITLVCAWKPDDEVVQRILDQVPVRDVEHWHDDYNRALESMKKFDVVLAEKLHVAVIAACRCVPFVALNYRSKVLDFCRTVDWDQFCLSSDGITDEVMVAAVENLAQASEDHVSRLRDSVASAKQRLLSAVPELLAALQPAAGG